MKRGAVIACVLLAGCVDVLGTATQPVPAAAPVLTRQQMADFQTVATELEPVAEDACDEILPELNCDFLVLVDDRPGVRPNAFHTTDRFGRPLIIFTDSLIASMANPDEMAFVFSHEAAHHILQHIPQTQRSAAAGILLGGIFGAAVAGGGSDANTRDSMETFARLGGDIGARAYSVQHEFEADELGALIANAAGYDPIRGVGIFNRLPNREGGILATHPPNARRVEAVRRTIQNI